MKILVLIGILAGILLCVSPEIIKYFFAPKAPQILNPDTFWKVNGSYASDDKTYELFYPPLPCLVGSKINK